MVCDLPPPHLFSLMLSLYPFSVLNLLSLGEPLGNAGDGLGDPICVSALLLLGSGQEGATGKGRKCGVQHRWPSGGQKGTGDMVGEKTAKTGNVLVRQHGGLLRFQSPSQPWPVAALGWALQSCA